MKKILNYLFEHKRLSREDAYEVLINIAQGKYNDSEIASFLTVYIMRSITVDELAGFRDALLELCHRIDTDGCETIDLCGTGGDGKDTFNISTLSSFVVAGAGYKVVKHGNYGVSSICGSSNVMEHFGYKFSNDNGKLKNELEKAGICFLHAPLFHPAMKTVAPIRKALKVKTFFNMLGPIVNPAFPKYQLVGVFSLDLARLYSYLFQRTDKKFSIIFNLDGYDEVSLTDDFKCISNTNEQILSPEIFGFNKIQPETILGGKTIEEAAVIFKNVLEGQGTEEQNKVVLANSSLAIKCFNPDISIEDCLMQAKESLQSKKALNSFKKLIES